jgi:hypothetical protein
MTDQPPLPHRPSSSTLNRVRTRSEDFRRPAAVAKIRALEKLRDEARVPKAGRAWTVEKWLLHWLEEIARAGHPRVQLPGLPERDQQAPAARSGARSLPRSVRVLYIEMDVDPHLVDVRKGPLGHRPGAAPPLDI